MSVVWKWPNGYQQAVKRNKIPVLLRQIDLLSILISNAIQLSGS